MEATNLVDSSRAEVIPVHGHRVIPTHCNTTKPETFDNPQCQDQEAEGGTNPAGCKPIPEAAAFSKAAGCATTPSSAGLVFTRLPCLSKAGCISASDLSPKMDALSVAKADCTACAAAQCAVCSISSWTSGGQDACCGQTWVLTFVAIGLSVQTCFASHDWTSTNLWYT